ncbi:hypothetical protein MMC15_003454 [Xylographa vitiligo]|nr:hypothetical protein [Xylographa vitiligo]
MVLYSLGSNGSGQLGIGSKDDCSVATRCQVVSWLFDHSGVPVKVVAGGNHTLVLYSTGQVYMAGFPVALAEYDITHSHIDRMQFQVAELTHPDHFSVRIKLCSATWEVSTLVTTDDHIFTFGCGFKGELGRGTRLIMLESLCPPLDRAFIPEGTSVIDLASGLQHTIIVLSNGDVYGWGNGRKGQLGEPAAIVSEPRKIDAVNFKVKRAVCGREFTYLVGDQDQGQHVVLGSDRFCVRSQAPESISGWQDIGASWGSIFVLHQSGNVISWGRNDHGQLAPGELPHIAQIAVGSEHVLALTADRKVLAWGWGEHGNCGPDVDKDGDVKSPWSVIKITDDEGGQSIIGVGAGCATSWLWTDSAQLSSQTSSDR